MGVPEDHRLHPADQRQREREDRDADRVVLVLPHELGGEGEEGHERQVHEVEPDEAPIDALEDREEGVVGHPVPAEQQEREEEAEQLRSQIPERIQQRTGVVERAGELGRFDRDDQQGHRDREHRVGEVGDPVEGGAITFPVAPGAPALA